MARLVVLGAGVSGHTAATFAKKWLGDSHEVIVISPNSKWNWIPSNIWVGVGEMTAEDVIFELDPVYKKAGIDFKQALAVSIHPEGKEGSDKPYVTIKYTDPSKKDEIEEVEYDYLINATGPKLNFAATEGLGPDGGYTYSVCTYQHATEANHALEEAIERMKKGERQKILIGTGHGGCTCQGAAFEYIFNVEYNLRKAGVRDKADIKWISNEQFLGDFGVAGVHITFGGYLTSSKIMAESLFVERGVDWITGAAVKKVEPGKVHYELLDGSEGEEEFDFSMLIPPFTGVGLKAYDKKGEDITSKLFKPNGFMVVDADYTPKPFEEWKASDWPKYYQNPDYSNIFAVGIAFAPPHPISKPAKSPNGTVITPAPPRTGMPSGIIGKTVAQSVCDMILGNSDKPTHHASMAEMGAACVASAGKSWWSGTAAALTVYPVVPDYEKYPGTGRDPEYTFGEVGLAGHWIKHILHYMFMWKAQLKPGWTLIPE
ncbi:MAG: FAD-dependent oxidoreductase [Epsilonproteobacteria bacterium]|nr:FAD-dependent oxidoreductase [Campylobacterota bacterium]